MIWSRLVRAYRARRDRRAVERAARPTGRCGTCGRNVYGPGVRRGYRQELLCDRCADLARVAAEVQEGP